MKKSYLLSVCIVMTSAIILKAEVNEILKKGNNSNCEKYKVFDFRFEIKNDLSVFKLKKDDIQKQLKLKVYLNTSPDINDETIIDFDRNATFNYDPLLDELKLFSKDEFKPGIYTMSAGDRYSVNAIPEALTKEVLIPVGLTVKVDGEYAIDASDTLNFNSGYDVYLIDKLLNKSQDLLKEPLYTFTFNRNDFENRFFMKFVNRHLQLSVANADANTLFSISALNGDLKILYKNPLQREGKLEIMNLLGQTQVKDNLKNNGEYSYKLERGCYLVRIISDNKVCVKKIYIE